MKRAVAEISKSALLHNISVIRECARDARICAVVKADAYGHGAKCVAEIIEGSVDSFAVATVSEGVELRIAGISAPILILGYTPISEASIISEYKLTQALISPEYARELSGKCHSLRIKISAQIKLDTGMHRLGFDITDLGQIVKSCTDPCYKIEGIFSHFSASDDENEHDFSVLQYARLSEIRTALLKHGIKIPAWHIANSAAILCGEYSLDTVRAGIALYGYGDKRFIPVMTLKSHICAIRRVKRGERVGYSTGFIADKDTTVATVPLGYADGIRRDAYRRGVHFLVGGCAARCIGNVCMDYLMLDVSDISSATLGSEVVIFGNYRGYTAEDLAEKLDTISYEILTSISKRVERFYVD